MNTLLTTAGTVVPIMGQTGRQSQEEEEEEEEEEGGRGEMMVMRRRREGDAPKKERLP